ncbi:MAG: hypothetical protein L0154_30390 [Chloroflexi bacterium]|nr:hypothetical protein [Chloroflexota bacterium]
MSDIRSTQEIFGDLFGGLASLGARGVDGLIIARAIARLLIQKGILTEDEMVEMMREIALNELDKGEDTEFVLQTYRDVVENLNKSRKRE